MVRKPLKAANGYSSGFVPKYQYGTESEGFGSSGRVEQDLTASEDSCAPKSKCIKVDDYDRFGVPTQTISLSTMSRLEKRDLVVKLKSELELVRLIQRKFYSLGLGSASNAHGNYNVPNRPGSVESFPISRIKKAAAASKKKVPPGRYASGTKGGRLAGKRIESVKQPAHKNTNFDVLMKQCEALLKNLMKQKNAWIFNKPVDIVESNIPDYFTIIKHPMDLGTVKVKLISNQYSSPMELAADVRLTFKNAMTYNSPGNAVHIYAATLSQFFESRWKSFEKKIPASTDESTPSKSSSVIQSEIASLPPAKKQKVGPTEIKLNRKAEKQVMTDIEKKRLGEELETLLEELPENIIDFLKESTSNGGQVIEDEIEIDIWALNDDTLFSLRKLLDDYLLNREKNRTPSEVEIANESGFSNPYILPPLDQGNSPADEDVDIGGNELPPISNLTTMEIDKDTIQRNTEDNSSSRSSSDSQSSSDSESKGLSADEADGPRDLAEGCTSKVAVTSKSEPKKTVLKDSYDRMSGRTEQNFSSAVTSNDPNYHQEEESAPHDRPVSPDKLYRAAILRSRFADIIIKVQENNLEKGETPGTGKVKGEREELERWRREEKARLQAEAKALEEDRKRAEARAEAEVRRKRELERKAARLALQKMEKTVDINENSQFMEDLEMFRYATDEHLQSSLLEDASPENSQNRLDCLKLQASSNPLEQLGLFMKSDEDEGVEQQSTPITLDNRIEEEMD